MLTVLFPWLSFLKRGMIGNAALCLVLQLSVLGWVAAILISRDEEMIYLMQHEVMKRKEN